MKHLNSYFYEPKNFSMCKKLVVLIILVISSLSAYLQNGAIKGFIYDKETGEALVGANAYDAVNGNASSTTVDGFYSLTKLEDGTYKIIFSMVGYEAQEETFTITSGKIVNHNVFLVDGSHQVGEAEVLGQYNDQEREVRVGVETVTPKDISKLPSIGTPDIAQYLQVIPGVTFTGDQGGQLYIRGGSPIQNKVLLDGMTVYNPFHSIGLFSVFETDIIKTADIYTGGFNANFGSRVSSIMDVKTIDGNKKENEGRVAISPFGVRAILQGPLKKQDEKGSSISYLLTYKKSYLEQSSKVLYDYIDEDGLPFNFSDLYGKVTFGSGGGSKFSVFGFSFNDDVKFQAISDFNWSNVGGGANFVLAPATSTVLINGYFSVSDYNISLEEESLQPRTSKIGGANFGLDFKYALGEDNINYGVQFQTLNTNFKTFNEQGLKIEQEENTVEAAFFIKYKKQWEKVIFEPGLRYQRYSSIGTSNLEPRLGIKYKPSKVFRIKAAAGLYSQNIMSANSDRDVVNLFYGFLTGPEEIQDTFINDQGEEIDVQNALQKAKHFMFGIEYDISEKINLNLEGYVKDFDQLTTVNRNRIFIDSPENQDQPEVLRKEFLLETGLARGVDVVLKYNERYSSLYFVYSLGKVDRWDGAQTYATIFDRRHNINFVASRQFGKEHNWEASLRWNFGSGFPFTQTQGYFEDPAATSIGEDYWGVNGEYGIIYGELNGGRLSDYHRLDLGLKKTLDLTNMKLEINAGVTNVYSRENIFYINRLTNERVNQLPFMPSLGFDLVF